jgi:uroporphyrinogen-III decarboxylase
MTSRERMLTALNNGRPDCLPCQVHGWMGYYLKNYLGGMDQWAAFEKFGMDFAIYVSPDYKFDTENAIYLGMDEPETLHHILESIVRKTLRVSEMWVGTPADMVEVGGGAGSSTVISPDFYREFGLPYDKRQNKLLHDAGLKVVNHFCGGLMPMLELAVESGADGLETMTPPAMGGDCNLKEASRRVGDKLFFIGGFDQNAGFERGTPENARRQVFECFESTKDHAGYICCPSDHFFHGNPENIQAFVDACRECRY